MFENPIQSADPTFMGDESLSSTGSDQDVAFEGRRCHFDCYREVLPTRETERLLRRVPETVDGGLEVLFLAALCQAYATCLRADRIRLELMKTKGRESSFVSGLFENPTHHDPQQRLAYLQKQLRRLPAGLSLGGHLRSGVLHQQVPGVQFQFLDEANKARPFEESEALSTPIDLCLVVGETIGVEWRYDRRIWSMGEILSFSRVFQESLKWLTVHCCLKGQTGAGPCDMP